MGGKINNAYISTSGNTAGLNESLIDFVKYSFITKYSMIDESAYVNEKHVLSNITSLKQKEEKTTPSTDK